MTSFRGSGKKTEPQAFKNIHRRYINKRIIFYIHLFF